MGTKTDRQRLSLVRQYYVSRMVEMSHKILIVSFLFVLVLSACTANPVFQNLPTAETPAGLPVEIPAELPVSAPATPEVVVVNTPTSPPVEIAPTAEVQAVVEVTPVSQHWPVRR
jgi:hypothetical protein